MSNEKRPQCDKKGGERVMIPSKLEIGDTIRNSSTV